MVTIPKLSELSPASKAGLSYITSWTISSVTGFILVFILLDIDKFYMNLAATSLAVFGVWIGMSVLVRRYTCRELEDEKSTSIWGAIITEIRHASITLILIPALVSVTSALVATFGLLEVLLRVWGSSYGGPSDGYGVIMMGVFLIISVYAAAFTAFMSAIHTLIEADSTLGSWFKSASVKILKFTTLFCGIGLVTGILFTLFGIIVA